MRPGRRGFVLLDRDGTLIVERQYLSRPNEVELLPNAIIGLQRLQSLGLGLVVVTNQSGVGRGLFSMRNLSTIHERLTQLLRQDSIVLDGIYVCPHRPEENCQCRKPKPGLALRAAEDLSFSLNDALVIGDKACDIDLGHNIGATTLLVRTGYGEEESRNGGSNPDFVVADLFEAGQVVAGLLAAESGKTE